MSIICPTITATNFEDLNNQAKLVGGLCKRVHLDLMDGDFAPTKTPDIKQLLFDDSLELDVHVMYRNPVKNIEEIITKKPSMVLAHAESDADIPLLATKLRENSIKTGLVLLPGTSVDSIKRFLPHVQHVLIFGGDLGYHGGNADFTQLEKVQKIKLYSKYVEIGWDGGANLQNVTQLKDAGIDVINVGSAIHKAQNPKEAYNQLVSLVS